MQHSCAEHPVRPQLVTCSKDPGPGTERIRSTHSPSSRVGEGRGRSIQLPGAKCWHKAGAPETLPTW